jgi:hypothetical protein
VVGPIDRLVTGKINSSSRGSGGLYSEAWPGREAVHRPAVIGKVRDIAVGLYLNLSNYAIVLRRDKKSQIGGRRVLRRCAAGPRLHQGVPYLPHETTMLFAAANVALARSSPNVAIPTTRSSSAFLQQQ